MIKISREEIEIILEMYEWVLSEGQETTEMQALIERLRKIKGG